MITQDDPRFKKHVSYLVATVLEARGETPYAIRTEKYDIDKAADPKFSPDGSEWITCGNCPKQVSLTAHCKWVDSGYIKYLDNVRYTPCCGKDIDKNLCPLVCVCCRRPMLFLTPHVNPGGFSYNPGIVYHLDSCSECDGTGGLKSMILEQIVYNKINGLQPE